MKKNQTKELQELSAPLARPYSSTRSTLGIKTRLFTSSFICDRKALAVLHDSISEKLHSLDPKKADFQYLISFGDNTHREHSDLGELAALLENSSKSTNKMVLKWDITHRLDTFDNELSVAVRISRPINPLLALQAALSKNIDDIDNVDFEGPVAVSVNGAGEILAQELFDVVGKWIDSRHRAVQGFDIAKIVDNNNVLVQSLNYWLLPVLFAFSMTILLVRQSEVRDMILILFSGIIGHDYIRSLAVQVKRKLNEWTRTASRFSIFDLTNGDANRQTEIAANAKWCTIKLASAIGGSFILNVLSAAFCAWLWGA